VGNSIQYLPPHSCLRTFPCSSVTSGSSLIELRRSMRRSLASVLPLRACTASHRMSKAALLCQLLGSSLIRDSQIAAMLQVAASGVELPSRRLWMRQSCVASGDAVGVWMAVFAEPTLSRTRCHEHAEYYSVVPC
jgi:hypothetical protein